MTHIIYMTTSNDFNYRDNSKWQIFGPIDQIGIGVLTEKLNAENAEYAIEIDNEAIDSYQENQKSQPFRQYPTFSGFHQFFHIKIPLKNCLIVKSDLEKLGFSFSNSDLEIESVEEFVCPKCDSVKTSEGFCEFDGVELIDYSEWVKFKSSLMKKVDDIILYTLGPLIFALIIYFYYIWIKGV